MKVVCFTYNRFEKITTSKALEDAGVDHDVVCHDENAAAQFRAGGRVNPLRLRVSGAPKGLANNRNWYLDNKLETGEWCLMLCDDFIKAREFDAYDQWPNSFLPIDSTVTTHWNRRMRKPVAMDIFVKRAEEVAKECDRHGVLLGGFSAYDNPLFRKSKWKANVLVDGRAMVIKKSALRFDPLAQSIDDYAFSALNLSRGYGTLINQWALADFSRYTKGSYGALSERWEQRRRECAYLCRRFPDLVSYAPKPGFPYGTHIQLRLKKKAFHLAKQKAR